MNKTFRAVDSEMPGDVESFYIPAKTESVGDIEEIAEWDVDHVTKIDKNVEDVDPDVVVINVNAVLNGTSFHEDYPVIYLQHGASVSRGPQEHTSQDLASKVDKALAPGESWIPGYSENFDNAVEFEVVGIPEADRFAEMRDIPLEDVGRTALYAPTNTPYGGGCLMNTTDDVLDAFEDSPSWNLRFRPHPLDVSRKPASERMPEWRDRVERADNMVFDDDSTPGDAIRESSVLITDDSGILAEWLHTGRPVIQFTDIQAERTVPAYGRQIDDSGNLTWMMVEQVWDDGYTQFESNMVLNNINSLEIPMDGESSTRAADEIVKVAKHEVTQ